MRAVILAVEPSADLHAAALVKALRQQTSEPWEFEGLGGRHLESQGVKIWEDPTASSEMGVSSLGSVKTWWRRIKETRQRLFNNLPQVLICVDSPDFNLRVAKGLRGKLKTIDYIAPQAWAWRSSRREIVGRLFDQVLVIWPFEEEFYQGCGAEVSWVGLPVLDHLKEDLHQQKFPQLPQGCRPVALLPGSRPLEVKLNLPLFVKAAQELLKEFDQLAFILPRAPGLSDSLFAPISELGEWVFIQEGGALACLQKAEAAMVVNGTATTEAMLMSCPHVSSYAVTRLQKWIYSPLMKTRFFHMANILLQKEVVPELVGDRCTIKNLVDEMIQLLRGEAAGKQRESFSEVQKILGKPGAAHRAAQEILKGLHG